MASRSSLSASDIQKAKEAMEVLGRLVDSAGPSGARNDPSTSSIGDETKKVVGLADDAMDVLRRMKAGVKAEQVRATKRQSKQEVTKLFNYATPAKRKKKVKASTEWKHKFSCLAYRGQIRIPTTDVEKDDLLQAGLGEKEISFHDMNASAEEFRDIICGEFPQLKKAGGFQLCKCKPNSRELEILSTFAHDCPGNLKQRVGNAKTYIRPLQKDMDLSVVFNLPDGPEDECLTCGTYLPLMELENHVKECEKAYSDSKQQKQPKNEDKAKCEVIDVDETSPSPVLEVHFVTHEKSPSPVLPEVHFVTHEKSPSPDLPKMHFGNHNDMEEEMVQAAMQQSLTASDYTASSLLGKFFSWKVQKNDPLCLDIRREFVVCDAIREAKKRNSLSISDVCWGRSSRQWWPTKRVFSLVGVRSFKHALHWKCYSKVFCNECSSSSE
ncbi:uncharacterized protein LOC135352326 isoform X1 [Halichondria panicea]|uniref:uncharacterized protein LOC135352326 isoform X1 n=2 Tax=Halichondria panicea TaxID=6063 RepID=UPI00312B72C6